MSSATVFRDLGVSCDTLSTASITTRGRFPRLLLCASLVFATCRSCYRTTRLLAPLFARITEMQDPLNEGREKPFAVASSSAIDVPLLRKLPLRMRARRPESPRVEVLPSNGEEEGNEEPRLTDSRAPSVTRFH